MKVRAVLRYARAAGKLTAADALEYLSYYAGQKAIPRIEENQRNLSGLVFPKENCQCG